MAPAEALRCKPCSAQAAGDCFRISQSYPRPQGKAGKKKKGQGLDHSQVQPSSSQAPPLHRARSLAGFGFPPYQLVCPLPSTNTDPQQTLASSPHQPGSRRLPAADVRGTPTMDAVHPKPGVPLPPAPRFCVVVSGQARGGAGASTITVRAPPGTSPPFLFTHTAPEQSARGPKAPSASRIPRHAALTRLI